MRPTKAWRAMAAVGAVALLAAACGSSTTPTASSSTTAAASGSGSSSTTAGGTTTTASSGGTTTTAASSGSGGTITVGELDAITGPKSEVGSWLLHGVKVGVYAVNQAGGVMGKKMTITASDTAGDSVDAVPALRKLMLKHPNFIVGPFSYVITTVIKDFGPAHTVDFTVGGTTTIDHMMQP
ncbi:MAG: ABC transporter substrate-binding protein, partial [Acidimicrobiales bacterium]